MGPMTTPIAPGTAAHAERLWVTAHEHVRRGDFAAATRDLAQCYQILQSLRDPRIAEVHRRWTEVHKLYLEDGSRPSAAPREVAQATPSLEAEAEAAANAGNLEQAITLYERALQQKPKNELVAERLSELRAARPRAAELAPKAEPARPAVDAAAARAAAAAAAAAAQAAETAQLGSNGDDTSPVAQSTTTQTAASATTQPTTTTTPTPTPTTTPTRAPPMASDDAPLGMGSLDVQIDMGEAVSQIEADELPPQPASTQTTSTTTATSTTSSTSTSTSSTTAAPSTSDDLPAAPVERLEALLARVHKNRRQAA
jgi:hypothetical protein